MVSVQTIATIVVKVFKVVLNIVILVLYRTGYNGEFLGVGGTWNLNEEKNPDAEIVASGVIVGYLIYTLVQIVTFLFGTTEHKRALSEIVMNFIGVFMWIAVGAVALHYWGGYQGEHQFQFVFAEKQVSEFGGGARVVWAMSAGDRESEAQAKKEEGSTSDTSRAAVLKQNWCIGLRIVELIFAIIAIGLMVGALNSHQLANIDHRHIALIYSTYSSFIIITGVLIIARLLGEAAGWRTSLGFSVIGVVMFTAAAAVIFYDWHRSYYANVRPNKQFYDLIISSGVFAIINAVVFIIHAFLTFKKEADY